MMSKFITNDYNYVDLKLPSGTLWAACNVGAQKPTDSGDFFAWAETKPKLIYSVETYNQYNLSMKYKNFYEEGVGTFDNVDAAHIQMGGDWRMPTEEQAEELMLHTDLIYCGQYVALKRIGEEKVGCKGERLIIPLGGYYHRDACIEKGEFGYLWTSNSISKILSNEEIPTLVLSHSQKYQTRFSREYGQNIRGVIKPKQ